MMGSCTFDKLMQGLAPFNDSESAPICVGQLRDMCEELDRYKAALQKIDEPMKYHHWEEDPYTRAGCFQFVAHEALKERV